MEYAAFANINKTSSPILIIQKETLSFSIQKRKNYRYFRGIAKV
jgi:hypothetical protein